MREVEEYRLIGFRLEDWIKWKQIWEDEKGMKINYEFSFREVELEMRICDLGESYGTEIWTWELLMQRWSLMVGDR